MSWTYPNGPIITVTGDFTDGFTIHLSGVFQYVPDFGIATNTLLFVAVPVTPSFSEIASGDAIQDTGGTRNAIKGLSIRAQDYADIIAINLVTFSSVPTTGAFELNINGNLTASIPFNATDGDIQTIIQGIGGYESSTVSGDFTVGFAITFTGYSGPVAVSENVSTLDATITVTEVVAGETADAAIFNDISTATTYDSYEDLGAVASVILGGTANDDANTNGFVTVGMMCDPENGGPSSYSIWTNFFANFLSMEDGVEANRPYLEVTYTEAVVGRRRVMCV